MFRQNAKSDGTVAKRLPLATSSRVPRPPSFQSSLLQIQGFLGPLLGSIIYQGDLQVSGQLSIYHDKFMLMKKSKPEPAKGSDT